jgi:membrane-associated HD superfamily phosphohydrolase
MKTLSKELKTTIAMLSACLGVAFIALVALFVRVGDMDKLGTSVLMLVLVAFVAVGSAVIVDEYHAEQRRQIARANYEEVQEVRNSLRRTWIEKYNNNNELGAQLANAKQENAEQLDEIYELKMAISQLVQERDSARALRDKNAKQANELRAERDELALELDELRYTVKAEAQRVADI